MLDLYMEPTYESFLDKHDEEIKVRAKAVMDEWELHMEELGLEQDDDLTYDELYEITYRYVADKLQDEIEERKEEHASDLLLEEVYAR